MKKIPTTTTYLNPDTATAEEKAAYRREAIESARNLLREIINDDTIQFSLIALRKGDTVKLDDDDLLSTRVETKATLLVSSEALIPWLDTYLSHAVTIASYNPAVSLDWFVDRIHQIGEQMEERLRGMADEGEDDDTEDGSVPRWFQL